MMSFFSPHRGRFTECCLSQQHQSNQSISAGLLHEKEGNSVGAPHPALPQSSCRWLIRASLMRRSWAEKSPGLTCTDGWSFDVNADDPFDCLFSISERLKEYGKVSEIQHNQCSSFSRRSCLLSQSLPLPLSLFLSGIRHPHTNMHTNTEHRHAQTHHTNKQSTHRHKHINTLTHPDSQRDREREREIHPDTVLD